MSYLMDSALDPQRLSDIATNDAQQCPAWHERAVTRDASELSDNLARQEMLFRQIACDVVAARPASEAIQAISDLDFTPLVAAQIASVLSARIAACGWSHWTEAVGAVEYLDSAHDTLTEGV